MIQHLMTDGMSGAGPSLPLINKILRTLGRTEDATPNPVTACIHLLSALGQQLAPAILSKHSRTRTQAPDDSKLPGVVPLPAAFFRPLKHRLPGGCISPYYGANMLMMLSSHSCFGTAATMKHQS